MNTCGGWRVRITEKGSLKAVASAGTESWVGFARQETRETVQSGTATTKGIPLHQEKATK